MKTTLKISMLLNLVLLGGLIFVLANRHGARTDLVSIALANAKPAAKAVVVSLSLEASKVMPKPFRWRQLESTNDYRVYVANLRASGCPEPTVRDIVRGDVERAFSFERRQLGLDGSGDGSWSKLRESQLLAGLLEEPAEPAEASTAGQSAESQAQSRGEASVNETPRPTQNGGNGARQNDGTGVEAASAGTQSADQPPRWTAMPAPAYPLAFQNVNLDALGLSAGQKAAIQEVQQQFVNDLGGPNQNPNDPAYLARWQKAQSNADDMLRGLLGTEAYLAYQQQLYNEWYQPQVQAAAAAGMSLTLGPYLSSQ